MWTEMEAARKWFFEQKKKMDTTLTVDQIPKLHLLALGMALYLTSTVTEKEYEEATRRKGWADVLIGAKLFFSPFLQTSKHGWYDFEQAYIVLHHAIEVTQKALHTVKLGHKAKASRLRRPAQARAASFN